MAAFEPILSGIPGLDQCLDSIRLGDNVVWQVSDLDEFRRFADPFVEQAKKDGAQGRVLLQFTVNADGSFSYPQ